MRRGLWSHPWQRLKRDPSRSRGRLPVKRAYSDNLALQRYEEELVLRAFRRQRLVWQTATRMCEREPGRWDHDYLEKVLVRLNRQRRIFLLGTPWKVRNWTGGTTYHGKVFR